MSATVRALLAQMKRFREAAAAAAHAENTARHALSDDVEGAFLQEYDDVVASLIAMVNAPELGATLEAIALELDEVSTTALARLERK